MSDANDYSELREAWAALSAYTRELEKKTDELKATVGRVSAERLDLFCICRDLEGKLCGLDKELKAAKEEAQAFRDDRDRWYDLYQEDRWYALYQETEGRLRSLVKELRDAEADATRWYRSYISSSDKVYALEGEVAELQSRLACAPGGLP